MHGGSIGDVANTKLCQFYELNKKLNSLGKLITHFLPGRVSPHGCTPFHTSMAVGKGLGRLVHVLSGPRLKIKTVLSTYGDFHVKDKTAVRTSYL